MGRTKQCDNDPMWERAARWQKSGMTHREIAGRFAQTRYMREFDLVTPPSDETVRRYLGQRRASENDATTTLTPTTVIHDFHPRLENHFEDLREIFSELEGIEVQPLSGQNLLPWWMQPDEPCWQIIGGQVSRNDMGSFTIRLKVEDSSEWDLVEQHYGGEPIWDVIEKCKTATTEDIAARTALFHVVEQDSITQTGLPIIPDISSGSSGNAALHPYYVMFLYDTAVAQVVNMSAKPIERKDFRVLDDKVYLEPI